MTIEELRRQYADYQRFGSAYGGIEEAASDVLAALVIPAPVDLVLCMCVKQSEVMAALSTAYLRGDASTWGRCMERMYLYNQFFVDWLEIEIITQGGVYL